VIVLDTSVLIEALSAGGRLRGALRAALTQRHRIVIPSLVLYEWLRGPRLPAELEAQEALFPSPKALPFGTEEAAGAAELYRSLLRPRGREIDLAIAATALVWRAQLWTLNPGDFADVPGLELFSAPV
jgi:predicted nucleic acid-binding protein